MSFESMLNHRCDIYHIRKSEDSPGFGLPKSPTFQYLEIPDIKDCPCHFSIQGGQIVHTVTQNEPNASYQANIKLVLPIGAEVRINDKVVDCNTGYEYTTEIPVTVRDHHKFIMLHRTVAQEAL